MYAQQFQKKCKNIKGELAMLISQIYHQTISRELLSRTVFQFFGTLALIICQQWQTCTTFKQDIQYASVLCVQVI